MIHYHGTPISKRDPHLLKLKGRHFCVSFAAPWDANWCVENGQSVMWDNGAFSTYTKGKELDRHKYYTWLDDKLYPPNWAVIPDVIDGCEYRQKILLKEWPYQKHLSAPVWHMALSLDYLDYLTDNYEKVCFGSSGKFWKVGSDDWCRRADEAWDMLSKSGKRNWIHMMRGLKLSGKRWPFASADSTNIARNHNSSNKCTREMADRIDSVQNPLRFVNEST